MGIFLGVFKFAFGLFSGFKFYLMIGGLLLGLWKCSQWKKQRIQARKEKRMQKAVIIQQNDAQRIIKVERLMAPGTIKVEDETGKTTTFKSEKSKKVYQKAISKGESVDVAKEKATMAAIEELKNYIQDIGTDSELKEEED